MKKLESMEVLDIVEYNAGNHHFKFVIGGEGSGNKDTILFSAYSMLSKGLKKLESMEVLDIVHDYEAMEEVLCQKLLIDRGVKLGLMFDFIDLSFRL